MRILAEKSFANGNEEYFYDSYKAKIDEIERKKP